MSNRLSLADIDNELHEIFSSHSECTRSEDGDPLVPATALVDIFRIFGERHGGMQLMDANELEQFESLLKDNPDIEVSPKILGMFITERTMVSPRISPENSSQEGSPKEERGRTIYGDDESGHSGSSRSNSPGSNGTHRNFAPNTPLSRTPTNPDSPFDSGRRQRTAPLQHAAPSSWNTKKALPHTRRRSDAGMSGRAMSDSETGESSRHSRPPSRPASRTRSRAPSNPASPGSTSRDLWGTASPPYSSPPMRPHSRSQSHGQFSSAGHYYDSIDRMTSPHDPHDHREQYDDDSFEASLTSVIPMPDLRSHSRHSDSDSDSDPDDDPTLGSAFDRSVASSMASMEPQDRLDALQRANAELARKLMDAEKTLQNRLTEHESELEELENRLDEAKSELMAAKREEKELRGKERSNQSQISALESEIAKVTKDLESSKQQYSSMQKLYQEQLSESEALRNALRHRELQYSDAEQKISLHTLEISKWQKQQQESEAFMASLEAQLSIAREAQAQLEEQKQENLMLKETIDRMRFDMDELRMKADGNNMHSGSSGGAPSTQNSISKSLGLEILRMNNGRWIGEEEDDEVGEGGADEEEKTVVEEESDGTEGEDVIQTIITKRKRKVASRAMRRLETIRVEDVKEYADAYTQHESAEFTTSHSAQTDPELKRKLASFSIQTKSEGELNSSEGVQTEPVQADIPAPVVRIGAEVQTDIAEPEPERSRSATPDEDMASSSSTLLPPTPKQASKSDLPPSYAQIEGTSASDGLTPEMRDAMQKLHRGLHLPLMPVPGGISEDALEEWAGLKEEMGFDCVAIDKIIEMSVKTGQARAPSSIGTSEDEPETSAAGARRYTRKNRFYNIYNTFVYGSDSRPAGAAPPANPNPPFPSSLAQTVLILGFFGFAASVLSAPHFVHPQYNVPGGPTYYDRAAWSEFNRMYPVVEGFGNDGVATVWDFVGRVGEGAARMARGWPT